jgi:hypothetical protein
MHPHVHREMFFNVEAFWAKSARIRLFSRMGSFMDAKVLRSVKLSSTERTLERSLSRVNRHHVDFEVSPEAEFVTAYFT